MDRTSMAEVYQRKLADHSPNFPALFSRKQAPATDVPPDHLHAPMPSLVNDNVRSACGPHEYWFACMSPITLFSVRWNR